MAKNSNYYLLLRIHFPILLLIFYFVDYYARKIILSITSILQSICVITVHGIVKNTIFLYLYVTYTPTHQIILNTIYKYQTEYQIYLFHRMISTNYMI